MLAPRLTAGLVMVTVAFTLVALLGVVNAQARTAAYGTAVRGHPNYQERTVLALYNLVRMERTVYLSTYLPTADPTLLDTFLPVHPLWWSHDLAVGARDHTDDMARTSECLDYDACDGTPAATWIREAYDDFDPLYQSQAVTSGMLNPIDAATLFICQAIEPPCPVTSGSTFDRNSALNGQLHLFGAGFTYSQSSTYVYYWSLLQVGFPTLPENIPGYPIPSGSHTFVVDENGDASAVRYIATFFDPLTNGTVAAGRVKIGSRWHEMAMVGVSSFMFVDENPAGGRCQPYFFSFEDPAGETWRYPTSGFLLTYGLGNCQDSYQLTRLPVGLIIGALVVVVLGAGGAAVAVVMQRKKQDDIVAAAKPKAPVKFK